MEKIILQVEDACPADWNKMTAHEQGRFCGQCGKMVIDFSQMNDQEIVNQIRKASQGLCGRFYEDQLMRELNANISFSKNPIWRGKWTGIAAGLMLVGFLSVGAANAQDMLTGDVVVVESKPRKDKMSADLPSTNKQVKVSVKVSQDSIKVNIRGKVVCASSDVSMRGTEVILGEYRTEVDEKGNFQLWVPQSLFCSDQELRAQMIGYKTVVIPFKKGSKSQLIKPIEMEVRPMIMGKIAVPKTQEKIQRK